MQRVYFFSDESGTHSQGRHFVVAGIAIEDHRSLVQKALETAEATSGKSTMSWHAAANHPHLAHAYLDAVLSIRELHGRAFYQAFSGEDGSDPNYFWWTGRALVMAMERFGKGKKCIIAHQGFNYATRKKLRNTLKGGERGTGLGIRFEVVPGSLGRPEVRLADSLAGFVRRLKFGPAQRTSPLDALSGRLSRFFVDP